MSLKKSIRLSCRQYSFLTDSQYFVKSGLVTFSELCATPIEISRYLFSLGYILDMLRETVAISWKDLWPLAEIQATDHQIDYIFNRFKSWNYSQEFLSIK